jgi:cytochrome c-type biogenesis protein CcmH
MTSVAAVLVSAPFLRRLDGALASSTGGDIAVYLDQLTEVEKDAAAGLIDADQSERARAEIKRRLLVADRQEKPVSARLSAGERQVALVGVVGLVVLGSVGLYALNGSPDVPSAATAGGEARLQERLQGSSAVDRLAAAMNSQAAPGEQQRQSEYRLASVDEMVDRLAERLGRNPKDTEGWRMLGWSYLNTGRFVESVAAYAKAIELSPDRADLRAAHGEALVKSAGGVVTEEAKADFQKALPWDPRARFFIGLMKEQAGDKAAALNDWIALLNEAGAEEPWYSELMQRVTELGQDIGVDVSARLQPQRLAGAGGVLGLLARQQEGEVAAANRDQPVPGDARAVEAMPPRDRMAMIQGMVEGLAARLERSPRDVEGWIKLIRSRTVLGELEAARQALSRALEVFDGAPQEQARIAAAGRDAGLMK